MGDISVITLDTFEKFHEHILQLAQTAQKQMVIYTPDLERDIYGSAIFIEAATKLIKRSRHSRVQILVNDTRHLIETGHPVLRLFRYTDDQFQLKKCTVDPASTVSAYFICDDHSMIRRQDADVYEGLCYTQDRARVKNQLEDFAEQWQSAFDDPNLRQLTL